MKKNRLILSELEESLRFWEDLFLISRLQEKAFSSRNIELITALSTLKVFPGLRTINHPEEFRRVLYEKSNFNVKKFLPLVPKEEELWLDPIDYARTSNINSASLVFFPYIIANWLKTKKVFQVDPSLIPLINPKKIGIRDIFSKKNFLSLLPYDAFVIHFSKPLEIQLEMFPVIKRYKCCIVARSGNTIDTFWVPEEIESKSIKPDGRELIEKLIVSKKIRERELRRLKTLAESVSMANEIRLNLNNEVVKFSVEPSYFTLMSFLIDKPYTFVMPATNSKNEGIKIYSDIFTNPPVQYQESNGKYKYISKLTAENKDQEMTIKESTRFQRFFFEFINGFCYAISEIKPRNPESNEYREESESNDFSLVLPWNEIPITRVDYLSGNEEGGKLKISYGSGEKGAHLRRGHWRHYVQEDGSVHKIWIDQIMVRADKLDSGGELKGSVAVIKEKRVVY